MKQNINVGGDIEVTSSSPDDPRISKKWGYVAAYPNEYLIHFRKGKFRKSSSGQGASCYKRFRDVVFIIPTSLKEVIFQANQLTVDNVDVRIRGMVVYRISNPLQIYTLLNFSNRQKAEEKLAKMTGDLCRSTAKWLVANMKVDECMRKRKEEIADALNKEISLIVEHEEKGWGVEINTIDIQDIYIQDSEIFNSIQTIFKADKMRESELAQLKIEQEIETNKLEKEKELAEQRKNNELAKFEIEKELEIKKMEREIYLAKIDKDNELKKVQYKSDIKEEQIRLTKQNEEKQFELDRSRVEENEKIARYKLEQEIEREKQKIRLDEEKTQQQVKSQKLIHQEELEALQTRINIENSALPISLERNFINDALPVLAEVIAKNLKDVKMNIIQQDGSGSRGATPFNFILMELMQILKDRMDVLKAEDKTDKKKKDK